MILRRIKLDIHDRFASSAFSYTAMQQFTSIECNYRNLAYLIILISIYIQYTDGRENYYIV